MTRIQNKPGLSKGGQTVIVSATNRIRPYWYQHRHNLNKRWPDEGFGQQGPSEVRSFIDDMGKHVENYFFAGVGQEVESAKKIFSEEPHSTWDNHFSGKSSMFENPIVIFKLHIIFQYSFSINSFKGKPLRIMREKKDLA